MTTDPRPTRVPKVGDVQHTENRNDYRESLTDVGSAPLLVPKVMIVENDEPLNVLLRRDLEGEGYLVETVERGEEVAARLRQYVPDVLVLDWTVPAVSGTEFCHRLRTHPRTERLPIMVLASSCEKFGCVEALSVGADDCLMKPFFPPEFVARVRALLRRAKPEVLSGMISARGVVLDRVRHSVRRNGKALEIGPAEFRLLEFLMTSPGRVFSREQLLACVWPEAAPTDERTIDVNISRLRKALGAVRGPELIRTVRGAGYSFGHGLM